MDAGIGKILDTLDRLKLTEDTIVFFTSDNGGVLGNGASNGPWRSEKQHMYEGGLRVPAIARWPNRIPANQRTDHAAVTMDLFATLIEAADVEMPEKIDGVSFLSTLLKKTSSTQSPFESPRDLYFVRREGGPAYGGKTIEALIRGEWKLLQDSPYGKLQLFNLRQDPMETQNLAEDQKSIFSELSSVLSKHIQNGGQVSWQNADP